MTEKIIDIGTRKEYEIDVKRSGENAQPCPKCSQDRKNKSAKSFSYDAMKEVGYCQNCNAKFVKKRELEVSDKKPYVRPKWTNATELPDKVVQWFKSRGISQQTLIDAKITYAEEWMPQTQQKQRVICFNYFRDGELINTKFRTGDKHFKLVKDAELIFYNLDAIKGQKEVVIVEGECFLPNAEVLTEKGWMAFSEYKNNRHLKVAQFNGGDKSIDFVDPIAFVEKQYSGELIEFKNAQRFYSITTPEHNLVFADTKGNILKKKYYEAGLQLNIPRVATHNGVGIDLSDNEIRLAIAVSADFTLRKEGDIYGAFKKDRKIIRLKSIIDDLGIEYSCRLDSRGYSSFFISRKKAPSYLFKLFPQEWIFQSTQAQKRLIIEEMLYWDGNSVPNRKQVEFSSKEYENAKFIQTIAHLCGYCSTIMPRENQFGKWFKVSILFNKINTSNQSLRKNINKVQYSGLVNCVQVPSGMILVRQDGCISVSGNCDALSYMEAGIKNVVSVPNGAAKGSLKLDYLDNCWEAFESVEKIYLATDDDEAGRILQDELARRLGKEKCYRVSFYGRKDPNELLQKDPLKLPQTIKDAKEYPIEGVYTAKDIESEIWALKKNGVKPACGIGIKSVDAMITYEGGYVTLVTGIPNAGKSEYVDQMIVGLNLNHGWKAAYFSPENWPMQLHHSKLATKLTGGNFNTESDNVTADAIRYCTDNFYMIFPEKDFALESILVTATQLVKKYGIKALVIDAWNKLDHLYSGNESQYISKELDKLDTFAKKTGVHVFLVAHPTKMKKEDDGINYVVPDGYSVAGSAAFFSKPANVICVHRRFFQDGTSVPEFYCQKLKFKHWGSGKGLASLFYNLQNGRYSDSVHADYRNYIEATQETLDFSELPKEAMKPNNLFINQTEIIYDGESTEYSEGSEECPF